jgi:tetratricopeptide (TPR) repeat protein
MRMLRPALAALLALLLSSCGSSPEAVKPAAAPASKEGLYMAGHLLYGQQQYDSAAVLLKKAAAMDSSFLPPVQDLAALYSDLGMRNPADVSPARTEKLREARRYYARLEARGSQEAEIYERLCEISVALEDDRSFLKYARKNAEKYPFDRQYYNLGLASFGAGDYTGTVRTQKEAVEKFQQSPYVGGFYRQMGRAYMKMDRDQTAERTLALGVQAVDGRIAEMKRGGGEYKATDAYRRLADDKIGMLLLLKRLHQTYKAADKLEQVERQLKEAGYTK